MTRRKQHKQLQILTYKIFAHCWKRVDSAKYANENGETKERAHKKNPKRKKLNQIYRLQFGSTLLGGWRSCCCCISIANILHGCMTNESENRKLCHETGTGIRVRETPLQLQHKQHSHEYRYRYTSEIHWPSMARHCARLFPLSCELIYCGCYWVADVVNALWPPHTVS